MGARTSRDDDDRLLAMVAMRCAGKTSRDVGEAFGLTNEAVRIATNRVFSADQKESGEAAETVARAYWGAA